MFGFLDVSASNSIGWIVARFFCLFCRFRGSYSFPGFCLFFGAAAPNSWMFLLSLFLPPPPLLSFSAPPIKNPDPSRALNNNRLEDPKTVGTLGLVFFLGGWRGRGSSLHLFFMSRSARRRQSAAIPRLELLDMATGSDNMGGWAWGRWTLGGGGPGRTDLWKNQPFEKCLCASEFAVFPFWSMKATCEMGCTSRFVFLLAIGV